MSFDVDPRDNRQQYQCDCGGNISQVADHYECDSCAFDSRDLKCDRCIEKNDAIAERDGKIRELEAMVERLRNCWNCKNSDVRCSHYEGPCCERWEIE